MSFIIIIFALSIPKYDGSNGYVRSKRVISYMTHMGSKVLTQNTYSFANDRTVLTEEIVSSASEFASANAS